MRGQTPNVVIKIEALMQIKFRVFNLLSRKNNLPPRHYQAYTASFLTHFLGYFIDDIGDFRKLYKRKRLSLPIKKGFELSLFLVY